MKKEWKRKSTDVLVAYLIFLMFVLSVHIITSVKRATTHNKDVIEEVSNLYGLLGIFVLFTIFMSPIWGFYRRVPKKIVIDPDTGKLIIDRKRKSKSMVLEIDSISSAHHTFMLYSVIEIHGSFRATRGHTLTKLISVILVPNFGMSWNKKTLREIQMSLKELNVPENNNEPMTLWEYLYS